MSETTENKPSSSRLGFIAIVVSLIAIGLDILGLLILFLGPMLLHTTRLPGLGARALFGSGGVISAVGIVLSVITLLQRGKNTRYGIVGLILGILPLVLYWCVVSFFVLGNF